MLRERLEEVRHRIDTAARRAGRRSEDVTLVAVTKRFPPAVIREAHACGLRSFGENYLQEFEGKYPEVAGLPGASFHFIGHLQSNKARRAAELFDAIHSVDSVRLLRRLDEAAAQRPADRPLEIMLEIRLSEEESKTGALPEEAPALVEAAGNCRNLRLTGLMTMPPWSEDPEPSRPYFRRLRELAESLGLPCLSMGMSHDLEVAIEEGATHVRVGTALFGPRERK